MNRIKARFIYTLNKLRINFNMFREKFLLILFVLAQTTKAIFQLQLTLTACGTTSPHHWVLLTPPNAKFEATPQDESLVLFQVCSDKVER